MRALACLAMIACSVSCGGSDPSRRPDVLLITVDTLRADHVSAYGYRLETTPEIDGLAARGVRFEDCTVQWPLTWPSIASLLSGSYPKTTGIRVRTRILPDSLVLMQEVFGAAGYETGAVVANFNIGTTFGFHQGFDHFVESWQEKWRERAPYREFANQPGRVKDFTNATIVTDQALAWLDSRSADQPFFLWLHYMDPHGPYAPPSVHLRFTKDAHPPEPFDLEKTHDYQRQRENGKPITDLAFYKARYDGEIRYLDGEIGRLLHAIEQSPSDRPRLIGLTADHGESLGEHDYYLSHGKLPYQPSARVPAILVMEGVLPAGREVPQPIGVIDFGETLIRLAGIEPPASFEGHDLTALIHGDASRAPDYVFMESGYDVARPQRSVRSGRWKLISVSAPEDWSQMAGTPLELYDILEDPGELHNLARQHPDVVSRLGKALAEWLASGSTAELGTPVDLEKLGPDERRMLEDLGYLEATPDTNDPEAGAGGVSGLKNPHN